MVNHWFSYYQLAVLNLFALFAVNVYYPLGDYQQLHLFLWCRTVAAIGVLLCLIGTMMIGSLSLWRYGLQLAFGLITMLTTIVVGHAVGDGIVIFRDPYYIGLLYLALATPMSTPLLLLSGLFGLLLYNLLGVLSGSMGHMLGLLGSNVAMLWMLMLFRQVSLFRHKTLGDG